MGQFALGEKPFLIKNCTSAVPHNITLFVKLEIIIVPEAFVVCLLTKGPRSFQ
jgi:hypothetical protein